MATLTTGSVTLTTTADDVRALLALVQRTPLSRAEALYVEQLFSGWLAQVDQASTPGTPPDAPPADQPGDVDSQASQALTPGATGIDQVQSI